MDFSTVQRYMDSHHRTKSMKPNFLHCDFIHSEFVTLMELSDFAREISGDEIVGVGIPMNTLSKKMQVTAAMVSKTIKGLEKRGVVERYTDRDDRRVIKVCFTQSGFDKFDGNKKQFAKFMLEVLEEMGDEDVNKLIELNEKLGEITRAKLLEKASHLENGKENLENGQNT